MLINAKTKYFNDKCNTVGALRRVSSYLTFQYHLTLSPRQADGTTTW